MKLSTLGTLALTLAFLAPSANAQDRLRGESAPPVKTSDDLLGAVVADGSFEGGTPNAAWTEASAAFGSPVCSVTACGVGGGTGPRTGTFWTWFGGAAAGDVGSMEQTVTVPSAASAQLKFWLEIPVLAAGGTGFVAALMDGTEVFRATYADDQATYATYALVTVDASAFADGMSHVLRFESTTTGSGNFFVDDVSIEAAIAGPSLSITPATIAFAPTRVGMTATQTVTLTNNGSDPVIVASAVASGSSDVTATGGTGTIASGASSTVTLTYAPTAAGPTTATLTVTSNAPNSPQTVAITGTATAAPSGNGVTFPSTDTPIAITDNDPTGITSTITVPATVSGSVTDANVDVNITHTWVGDLIGTVSHGGVSVIAWDRPGLPTSGAGCSANNMVLVLDDDGTDGAIETACEGLASTDEAYMTGGIYTPSNPLSAFNATAAAGDWTLNISDNANLDTGTLNSWAMIVEVSGVSNTDGAGASVSRLAVAPNPIAGSAQIDLTVGTTQDVRVALYDALGREVAVVFDRAMTAGQQAYIAVTTEGLPSGVYVVRATGTDLSLTQRVTVVR